MANARKTAIQHAKEQIAKSKGARAYNLRATSAGLGQPQISVPSLSKARSGLAAARAMPKPPVPGVSGASAAVTNRNNAAYNHRARAQTRAAGGTGASQVNGAQGLLDLMNSPEFQSYNDSYSPNLDAARSAIQNSYAQAMGEIQKREGLTQQFTNAYPGQINAAFDYGGKQLSDFASQAAGQAAAAGGEIWGSTEGITAPIQAANEANRASRLADVPLLQASASGVYSQQRQELENTHGQALADIAAQEAEMRASREGSLSDAQKALIDATNQDNADAQASGEDQVAFGPNEISGNRGRKIQAEQPRLMNYIKNNANGHNQSRRAYTAAVKWLSANRGKKTADEINAHMAKIWRAHQGQAEAISLAMAEFGY